MAKRMNHVGRYIKADIEMGYKLYNALQEEIVQSDLQDKMAWCSKGEDLEHSFIEKYGSELDLIINPKKIIDPNVWCVGH